MAVKGGADSRATTLPNGGSLDEADIALIETVQKCRSILGASKLRACPIASMVMLDALNRTLRAK